MLFLHKYLKIGFSCQKSKINNVSLPATCYLMLNCLLQFFFRGGREKSVIFFVSYDFYNISDENYNEDCLTCLTNQGEIAIFTVPDLRRQQIHNCIKREDIT